MAKFMGFKILKPTQIYQNLIVCLLSGRTVFDEYFPRIKDISKKNTLLG
jgi:hypothetical protein